MAFLIMPGVMAAITNSGPDLSNRFLSSAQFHGRDLRNAALRNSDLSWADFSNADLRGANFGGAEVNRINLDGADLRGIVGWSSTIQHLGLSAQDADFSGTDLRGAIIGGGASGAYFERSKFDDADLGSAILLEANLRHADLTGADLSNADLTGADLTGAKLKGISIEAAIIEDVKGLDHATVRQLRKRAARWKYDLESAIRIFLWNCSVPIHIMLAPIAALLAAAGCRSGKARASFKTLLGINLASMIPLACGILFSALGGSPTVQLSNPGAWTIWASLWPWLQGGSIAVFLVALGVGGRHLVKHVFPATRTNARVATATVLVTIGNTFIAVFATMRWAPNV